MRSQTEHGYSLVELVIVISVLATLAAMAVPAAPSFSSGQLDLAAEEMAAAMRFARSEALRTGAPHGFHQESVDKRIRVYRLDQGTTPPTPVYDVYNPVSKQTYDIDLDQHALAAADSLSLNAMYRGACIDVELVYFDSDGTPWCSNPSGVLLQYFELTLTLGSNSRVVRTDGMTGRVTVQ